MNDKELLNSEQVPCVEESLNDISEKDRVVQKEVEVNDGETAQSFDEKTEQTI